MNTTIHWSLSGRHKDGSSVLSKQEVQDILSLLEVEETNVLCGFEDFVSFDTHEFLAKDKILHPLQCYTVLHPDVVITAYCRYETMDCPDRYVIWNGMPVSDTGHVEFERDENNDTVYEYCSECDSDADVEFDLNCGHLETVCPFCGEKLMLCSMCPVRDNVGDCDWDRETDTCRYSKKNTGGHG